MPNFYAHLQICRRVEELVPEKLGRLLHREEDAYFCGGFGPDPLYFCVQGLHGGNVRQAGLDIHHHSGAAALEAFRRPVKEHWPYAASFAAGYLLHFLLDSRCHPFIKGVAARGQYTHFALEGEYDRYLLRHDRLSYQDALPKKPLPRAFYELAAQMAEPVTPEIYEKALANFRWGSIRLGRWAGKPLRHVVNAASRIPSARSLRGMILPPQADFQLERHLLSLDRLCAETARAAPGELTGFFRAVEEDRPFSETLSRDYSGGKEEQYGIH